MIDIVPVGATVSLVTLRVTVRTFPARSVCVNERERAPSAAELKSMGPDHVPPEQVNDAVAPPETFTGWPLSEQVPFEAKAEASAALIKSLAVGIETASDGAVVSRMMVSETQVD